MLYAALKLLLPTRVQAALEIYMPRTSGQVTASFKLVPETENIISREFKDGPVARVLFTRFLNCAAYCSDFAEELIRVAAGFAGASWELRRACVLMLENQVLSLAAEDLDEHDRLLRAIGMKLDDAEAKDSILVLRDRLSRLSRVHHLICGQKTTATSLADFLHVARQECKLTLARYFFKPQEVAARLLSLVRVSRGLVYWVPPVEDWGENGAEIAAYEREVIAALSPESIISWTDRRTPSAINSLVESPLGTVVLVIKLPGSDLELEIKRTGVRGPHPLQIKMPNELRLFGGSSGGNLEVEANSAHRLAQLYYRVHGCEAPVSTTLCTSSIQTIPAWQGEAHLVDYFSDRSTYGNGYRLMRSAMDEAMRRFEPKGPRLDLPGPMGLTVRYLHRMLPRQSWLRGSTAFRLDLLECYLSSAGPSAYFTELQRLHQSEHEPSPSLTESLGNMTESPCYTQDEARRFADDLLEEILGVFVPPADCSGTYSEYVERAMALPVNRSRADSIYLSLLREIGVFWGTLLATCGCSHGESFVRRNVGLKSQWRNGRWQVRIIFMDHDLLWVPGQSNNDFDPKMSLEGMRMDSGYLFEHKSAPNQQRGVIGTLERIYRIQPSSQSTAATVLEDALAQAYRKTRCQMVTSAEIRKMFSGSVLANMADWEAIVWDRLESEKAGIGSNEWASRTTTFLRERGYMPDVIEKWIEQVEGYLDLLARYSSLFDPKYLDFNLSYKHSAG
jgi:hypothetical protein